METAMWNPFRKDRPTPEEVASQRMAARQTEANGEPKRLIAHYDKELKKAAARAIEKLDEKRYPTLKHQPWNTLPWKGRDRLCWHLYAAQLDKTVPCEHPTNCTCADRGVDEPGPRCTHRGRGKCDCAAKYVEHILLMSTGDLVLVIGDRHKAAETPAPLDVRALYEHFVAKAGDPEDHTRPGGLAKAQAERAEEATALLQQAIRILATIQEFSPSTIRALFDY